MKLENTTAPLTIQTDQAVVSSAATTVLQDESKKRFRELMALSGISVVKRDQVPAHYKVKEVKIQFPKDWSPSMRLKDSVVAAVESKMRSIAARNGVFEIPGTLKTYAEADIHQLGASAPLQPDELVMAPYLLHEWGLGFTLWDDAVLDKEDCPLDGKESVGNVVNLLKLHMSDLSGRAVQGFIDAYDGYDRPFLRYFKEHFDNVASVDGHTSPFYQRYMKEFLIWCDALVMEMDCFKEPDMCTSDVETKWQIRTQAVGVSVMFAISVGAADFHPSNAFYDSDLFQRVKHIYCRLSRELNELASIPKDVIEGCGNIFVSTMVVKQASFGDIFQEFQERINRSIAEYDELSEKLLMKHPSMEGLDYFLRVLRYSLTTIADWHFSPSTKRYDRIRLMNEAEETVMEFRVQMV